MVLDQEKIFLVDLKTIDQPREKLKINGLKDTAYRIAKTWFVEEEKSKYFHLCEEAGKKTSIEVADNSE